MARNPRKRVALSFSDGHRLTAAFKAAGLAPVPDARDLRDLLELGLAARAAGLHAVQHEDGCFHLARPISGEAKDPPAPAANRCVPESHSGSAALKTVDDAQARDLHAKSETAAEPAPEPHVQGGTAKSDDVGAVGEGKAGTLESDDMVKDSVIDDGTRQLLARALQF